MVERSIHITKIEGSNPTTGNNRKHLALGERNWQIFFTLFDGALAFSRMTLSKAEAIFLVMCNLSKNKL